MLESVQKRAFRMICPNTDFKVALIFAGTEALHDRRESITAKFFNRQVLPSTTVLHYLLPDLRDNETVRKLRNPRSFHAIPAHKEIP